MSGERRQSDRFLDARMHPDDEEQIRAADAAIMNGASSAGSPLGGAPTMSTDSGGDGNRPSLVERSASVPDARVSQPSPDPDGDGDGGGGGGRGKRDGRPTMPAKNPSYRVHSDGTASVGAFVSFAERTPGGSRAVSMPSDTYGTPSALRNSVCPMGARHCGVATYRKARREQRMESRRRRRLSKRNLMSEERRLSGTGLPMVDESTSLIVKDGGGKSSKPLEVDSGGLDESERSKATEREDEEEGSVGVLAMLSEMIFGKAISLLLIFIPFAWASHHYGWNSVSVFWLNFLAMVPLASLLGDFTEEVAAHTNQVVGGLINATFGNAVEVVVGIQALLANEIRVVQASMIGSIFSNLLLVLGGCFFFGGLRRKEQSFNSTAATANMSLLALSSLALVLPTPFAEYYDVMDEHVLTISRITACFLIFMYLQLLVFQLRTHVHLFDDDDDEEAEMPLWVSLTGLVFVTLLIAQLSDYLVESIDGFCVESGVSRTFVGLIILPIVGNAVEHITAINVAMKDKMDLAMGVAVGSCTQISLFVIPVTVLVGWAAGKPMTLNFPQFEIVLFVLSIVIVSVCISNPKSNWLEGSLLMTTYFMIAVGFWFEKVISYNTGEGGGSAAVGGVEL